MPETRLAITVVEYEWLKCDAYVGLRLNEREGEIDRDREREERERVARKEGERKKECVRERGMLSH